MTNHLQEPLSTYPKPGLTHEQEQVDEEIMSLQALRITTSLAFPMVFKAALELGVLDTIVAGGNDAWLSSTDIAFALPTKPTNPEAPVLLDRMLRLLASHSIFKCRIVETGENYRTGKTQRVYAAEPVCTLFLNRGDESGSLMSLFMLLQSQVFFKTWSLSGKKKTKRAIVAGKDVVIAD